MTTIYNLKTIKTVKKKHKLIAKGNVFYGKDVFWVRIEKIIKTHLDVNEISKVKAHFELKVAIHTR